MPLGAHGRALARSHRHLRSVRSATREPGAARRCGAAQRRTQAVSASTTRARSALPKAGSVPGCAPLRRASLHLTACDGWGTRRVGRAVQGRSCWAVVLGHRVRRRLPPKGAHEPARAAHAPGAAAPPMALRREPAGEDERSARPPAAHGARKPPERGRCVAHSRSDDATSPRSRSRRPRARAVGIFAGGDIKRGRYCECRPRQKTVRGRPCNLLGPSLGEAKTPRPNPLLALRLVHSRRSARRWLGTTPSRKGGRHGTRPTPDRYKARPSDLGIDTKIPPSSPWALRRRTAPRGGNPA